MRHETTRQPAPKHAPNAAALATTSAPDVALATSPPTTRRLAAHSLSANTRAAYTRAVRQFDAWRGAAPATDATLAAYLGELFEQGRAPATAALAVAAVTFRAALTKDTIRGPLTDRVLAGFRRDGADRAGGRPRRSWPTPSPPSSPPPTSAARRAGPGVGAHRRPPRRARQGPGLRPLPGRAAPQRSRRPRVARRRASHDRGRDPPDRAPLEDRPGGHRRRRPLPQGRRRRRRPRAAPADVDPTARVFGGLTPQQLGRRFTAAAKAAGIAARLTAHSGRVGLASELTARGAVARYL